MVNLGLVVLGDWAESWGDNGFQYTCLTKVMLQSIYDHFACKWGGVSIKNSKWPSEPAVCSIFHEAFHLLLTASSYRWYYFFSIVKMRLSAVRPRELSDLTKVYLNLPSVLLTTSRSYSLHFGIHPLPIPPSSGLSSLICKMIGFGRMMSPWHSGTLG